MGSVAAAAVLGLSPATPQAPSPQVSLVPELAAATRGRTFRVAARVAIPDGWHIGWKHPGQTGLATNIEWQTAPGITVGQAEWAFPERAESAGVVSHVYRGEALIVTSFSVDTDARHGPATLVAELHWGLCREICIPQGQRLRVSIPIVSAEQAAEPAPNWGNVVPALEERLPIAPEDAGYDPRRQRGGVRLVVRNGHSAFGAPASLVYFPEDANRAAVALLSRLRITEGGLVVPLAIPSDARIDGVLVSERGWAPGKRARALRLSLP